jgi:hypothetical protein
VLPERVQGLGGAARGPAAEGRSEAPNPDDARVDPDRVPRLPDETGTVLQRVMRFREVRDTKVAHGGRTAANARQLTYFDLMEAQWVVAEMIVEVLGIA